MQSCPWQTAAAVLGARPASQKLGENSNGDRRSKEELSLCPECNREAVDAVIKVHAAIADFRDRPGIIEAQIVEEAGRILMRKACEKHGPFEDVLSNHPDFFRRMESLAFGKDFNVPATKWSTITAQTASRQGAAHI